MPRTERYPHFVRITKKEHKCRICHLIIPKGSVFIRYKNVLSGRREYYHNECPEEFFKANRERMRLINEKTVKYK